MKNYLLPVAPFKAFLIVSGLAHLVFLGGTALKLQPPQFAVTHGKSSVEIVLLKQEKQKSEPPKQKVLSVSTPTAPEVAREEKKPEEEKPKNESAENLYVPAQYGSLTEYLQSHLKNPAPVYPRRALENRWEGRVILEVMVSKAGRAEAVSILQSSGKRVLDEAAVKAVRRWNFLPASLGEFKFSSRVRIPIRFELEKD